MRITDIHIKNFRAFYGEHHVCLDKSGKNLMVYGENGSGKSSLFLALKTFFEASSAPVNLLSFENIFLSAKDIGTVAIKLKIKQDAGSSSSTDIEINATENEIVGPHKVSIANANQIKGFFDYKSLLKTHMVDTKDVNLFTLFVKEIIKDQTNRFSGKTFGKEWDDIVYNCFELRQGVHVKDHIEETLKKFNNGIVDKLKSIEADSNTFILKFGYSIKVKFIFIPIEYKGRRQLENQIIGLDIEFFNQRIPSHQHFLNEARLSALAISMYLATVKSDPSIGVLRTLVLDDLLIGLDMGNRIPLLHIIRDHFEADFQIMMTTYDKIWFELVRNFFGESTWKYIDIYSRKLKDIDFEMPLVRQNTDYISKAEGHLTNKDYKASAVYIRSEFEKLVIEICDKQNLLVKYKIKTNELKSNDYWDAIVNQSTIDSKLTTEIETCRGTVMNPFSHYDLKKPQFQTELVNTIAAVKKLKSEKSNIKKDNNKKQSHLEQKIKDLEISVLAKEETIKKMGEALKKKNEGTA